MLTLMVEVVLELETYMQKLEDVLLLQLAVKALEASHSALVHLHLVLLVEVHLVVRAPRPLGNHLIHDLRPISQGQALLATLVMFPR